MRKNFTYLFVGVFLLSFGFLNGQNDTIWPTKDTNTIKASQFNGGLNGWTTKGLASSDAAKKDSAVWVWTAIGDSDNGGYGAATQKIASPSVTNGSVIFDSDFLDNGGIQGAFGTGKAPTTAASPHAGELISPIINATGFSNFSIQFNQLYRNFNNRTATTGCFVTWSEDGGTTWKPLIKTNSAVAGLSPLDSRKLILLPGSVGTANFRIKFVFQGNYYFWIVDDVILSTKKVKDIKVSPDFYALPVSGTHVPKNQLEPIYFLADVINDGNVPMPNVKLTAKMWRVTGTGASATQTEIFTSTRADYGTIKGDTAIENRSLPNFVAPSALSVGVYRGAYIISSDSSDDNRLNDTIYFPFNVTDSLFRKETGANQYYRFGESSYDATATDRDWQAAQSFFVVDGKKSTLAAVFAPMLGRAVNAGKTLFCGVYEFKDLNGNGSISKDERSNIVAAGELIFLPSDTGVVVKRINIFDIGTNKAFTPKDTTNYLVSLEYDSKSKTDIFSLGFSEGLGVNYGAANFAYSEILGKSRYSYFLGVGDVGTNVWNPERFGAGTVPAIRMYLYPFLVDTKEILSDKNKFEIYPNPASNSITLDIELENMTSVMLARVLNLQGQVMMEKEVDNFKNGNVQLDVTNLVSGNYMVQIFSKDGTKTKQVVITK